MGRGGSSSTGRGESAPAPDQADDGAESTVASLAEEARRPVVTDARPRGQGPHQVEEWFRLCFEHAPVAMALVQPDGRYSHVNPAMVALTGYHETELTQLSIADILHPDDVADGLSAVAALVAGERDCVVLEERYLTPSGDYVWAAGSATLMRRPDGSPHYVVAQLNDISAAKRSERILVKEHDRLQRAESIGRVGSWELDVTTQVVTWSPGLSKLMGRRPVTFAGDLAASMANIHAPDFEAARSALRTCARTGEPQQLRYRINRASDGVTRWIDARGVAVYENGQVVRIDGVVADVTEQVEADEASASARAYQQAIMTASPDIMFVWDVPSQSAVWTNRRLSDELGYTDAHDPDVAVNPVDRAVPADLKANYDRTIVDTLASLSEDATQVDLPLIHADGTRRWYSRRIAPLHRDENGAVTQIVGVLRDTTSAMAIQNSLRDSEAKFRQLADNIDVAFTLRTWDPDQFLYVSPGYQKIFGYDPGAVSESPTQSLAHIYPPDQDRFMSEYWAVCRAGKPVRAEYRIVRPDGVIRWVRATNSPVKAGDGEPRRSAAICTDITDSREAESALAAAHKAESANAAKNEFLGRMSHELRTPMNAILGFAQLLEMDAAPGPEQDAVQHILRGGRHLVSLIDDVLDIASIEDNRLELDVAPVSVAQLLLETTELMSPLAAAAHVELVYRSGADGDRWVRADSRRLRQVVLNLLSNAIKYNHPNGRVEVRCESAVTDPGANRLGDEPLGRLDIVVSDTGRGIRAEDLPRLFTPFDRLGVQDSGIEGTGVGLALSLRLMSMMGGGLHATSHYGVGSRFSASLAVAESPVGPAENTAASPDVHAATDGAIEDSPLTLLYIEDVNSNVELMESLIKRRPRWRMIVAGRGRLGEELASTAKPDLVLLDVELPDMTGDAVLLHLRADPATRALPVFILSADANPNQIDRLMAAGADGYLTKPIAVAEILQLLQTYDSEAARPDLAGEPGWDADDDGSTRPLVRAAPAQP